jgi:hypothetical protein
MHEVFNARLKTMKAKDLRYLCQTLAQHCSDLQLYAKRYSDGRSTYAPTQVNQITRSLLALGVSLNPGGEQVVWAQDGNGRAFDRLTDEELTPGTAAALGRKEGEDAAAG